MKLKIFVISFLLSITLTIESQAYWVGQTVPGNYGGKDKNDAIICLGTEGVCFTLWKDLPGPSGPNDPEPPGYYTGVALYIPYEGWGLIKINGVNYTQLSGNIIYTPVKTPETEEVTNESQIIDWLNNQNGSQP